MRPILLNGNDVEIPASELVLNPDGSVYHLALRPEQLADTVLLVGDPGRVALVAERFDRVEHSAQNREFVSRTGHIGGHRLTVLSTGIGPDNIDIVLNELDALVNIDLENRRPKAETRSLRLIRMGTCGSLQEDIPVDERIISHSALGLDGLLHYYAHENSDAELRLLQAILTHAEWPENLPYPYIAFGDSGLVETLGDRNHIGITATAGGFYAPQGRQLRAIPAVADVNDAFSSFAYPTRDGADPLRIANFEMETSALYGLSGILGHRACTVCTVVANRLRKEYSKDHQAAIGKMIDEVLDRVAG